MKNQSLISVLTIALLLFLSFSCGQSKFITSWYFGNFGTDSSSLAPSPITLSNFQISNVVYDGLDISVDYTGDNNENAVITMYYCSNKQSSGCNPLNEESTILVRSGSTFTGTLNLSSAPFTPGDILKYQTVSADLDGVTGGAINGYVVTPHSGESRAINQLGYITFGGGLSSVANDQMMAAAMDDSGNIFIAGWTAGCLGELNGGGYDAFVAKLDSTGALDTTFGGGDGIAQLGEITVGGTKDDGNEYVNAIIVDSSGNIFIAGYSNGSFGETNGGGNDVFVAKLDSTGAFDTTFGGGDGIAQLGDVTIGGAADDGNDSATVLQLDNSGNIFVAGNSTGSLGETNGGSYDVFLVKLNSTGALDTTFGGGDGIIQLGDITVNGGSSSWDYTRAIFIDNSGNIFIAGDTNGDLGETNGGNMDAFVVKLNSTGVLDTTFGGGDGIAQLGEITLPGTENDGSDNVATLLVTDSGNIFIAGTTYGSLGETSGGGGDGYIVKLDSTGTLDTSFGGEDGIAQLGDTTVGGTADDGTDSIESLFIDSSGKIIITGYSSGPLGETNGGSYDVFAAKLDSTGTTFDTTFSGDGIAQLGETTLPGTGNDGWDSARASVVDSSGNIFIMGQTNGSLGEASGGAYDIFAVKLNSAGIADTTFGGGDGIAQLGYVTIGGMASSGDDMVTALAIDGVGNTFLAGYTTGNLGEKNGGGTDAFVIKLNSAGALDTTFGGGDGIAQLGDTTVGGTASSGDEQVAALAIDGAGNVFITGYTTASLGETNGGSWDVFVAKLDSTGALDTTFGDGDGITQLGEVTLPGAANDAGEIPLTIFVDSGNIFVAGYTYGALGETNGGNADTFVVKLNSTGALDTTFGDGDGIAQLGEITLPGGANNADDTVTALVVDGSGNIFIAGYTNGSLGETKGGSNDIFIAKMDSTGALDLTFGGVDGITQLGDVTFSGGPEDDQDDRATALAIDGSGDIFIAGNTYGALGETNGGLADAFVVKLDSDGILDTSFGGGDGITQLGETTLPGAANDADDFIDTLFIDSGNIFIAGYTGGALGETSGGGYDSFVVKLNSTGALDTTFGGGDGVAQLGNTTVGGTADNGDEVIKSLIIDGSGNIFIAGFSDGSLGEINAGSNDAFLVKLDSNGDLSPAP